jgi:phospholipid-transporting ATPase
METNTVICSRVSPKQKADLINLVKNFFSENITTLAIGDGANDVNMINAADVGIGIMGNEGQQAARASDYVIGQFSFLQRLLFVHGRESNRKNSFAIGYILWKNFLYVMPIIM